MFQTIHLYDLYYFLMVYSQFGHLNLTKHDTLGAQIDLNSPYAFIIYLSHITTFNYSKLSKLSSVRARINLPLKGTKWPKIQKIQKMSFHSQKIGYKTTEQLQSNFMMYKSLKLSRKHNKIWG